MSKEATYSYTNGCAVNCTTLGCSSFGKFYYHFNIIYNMYAYNMYVLCFDINVLICLD